ncbi:MAG: efflux RND transporter periplasmic adaptor subunit [Acidobacteriota bacterium]
MSKGVKIVVGVLVVAGLAGVVLVSQKRSSEKAVKVEVTKVEPRSLSAVVEASGQIEPAVSVDISSDVIGKIVKLGAEEGDHVARGQFLIQIDPVRYQQTVARLETELATARTNLQEAEANLAIRKADYDRDQRLYKSHLIPFSKFQSTEANYHVAEARVAASRNRIQTAEASIDEARENLDRCRILSPMDGVVIRKNVEVGEVAISGTMNNQGSLLMTIADLSVMETEVDVDETDVVHVQLNQDVEVSLDAFPSRTFKGRVSRIGNSAIQTNTAPGQRQSADYKVEVTLTETDPAIRPGLSATARITTGRRENVLSVPIQALVVRSVEETAEGEDVQKAADSAENPGSGVALAAESSRISPEPASGGSGHETTDDSARKEGAGEGKDKAAPEEKADKGHETGAADGPGGKGKEKEGVFVIRDGKAVFMPVKTGIAGEKFFEVMDGLAEGDQVVSGNFAALRKLKAGTKVEIEKKDRKKTAGSESGD